MNLSINDLRSILLYDKVNTSKYLRDYLEERLRDVIDQTLIRHYKRVIKNLQNNFYPSREYPLIALRADLKILGETEVINLMKEGIIRGL